MGSKCPARLAWASWPVRRRIEGPEGGDFEEEEPEATVPDQEGKTGGTRTCLKAQRPQRTAAVWAWACLEKYCELHSFEEALTDIVTVPASVLFGRKRPASDDHPTSRKHAHTAEAEEQTCPTKSQIPLFPPRP